MRAIEVRQLSKQYRLGQVGTGTLSHDLNRWWHRVRGKEDPYLKLGETNVRSQTSASSYVWALQDINFEVDQGEVLGIIGKNGAGKSTLLKILSKVTGPTTGSIKARGRIASLLEVGTGFHPELTGRENIFLNGTILGMTRREVRKKLDEIVDFAGVARYLDTPVKRYSSGMMVRLGFAVAAHLEPEILIVDEVLAVGDAEFQKKAVGKMKAVSETEGRTVLFVSHNMGAVKNLCQTGLLLADGRVSYRGTATDSVYEYMKATTAVATVALETREDRRGSGVVHFKSIQFLNEKGDLIDRAFSGQNLKVLIEFQKHTALTTNVIVRLEFVDEKGDILFLASNWVSNGPFNELPNKGFFECTIPKLPLNAGAYYINLTGHVNNKDSDVIYNAIQLNVERGFFYNTGHLPAKNMGLLVDNHWAVREMENTIS